ncbi:hypothetical protein B0O99DRAFT_680090 [Bisporella sp. PMI_857]|nr:hypothetical protein B0O99DRAFT_680090 [Bisporella sp. PMI_857]
MHSSTLLLLASALLPFSSAQQQPDGLIVPFTSVLPACASLCGKLFDVQGACVPPEVTEVSKSCFCSDPRLKSFLDDGTAGVSEVCTAASCTDATSLGQIKSWYESYCNIAVSNPTTTAGGSGATGTGSSAPKASATVYKGWWAGHWKWVVMLIVMVIAIAGGWVGAAFLRKRYLRKKEREIEMRPPVAWGPHQMQGATGGYGDNSALASPGGYSKEAAASANNRQSKGWLRKQRS